MQPFPKPTLLLLTLALAVAASAELRVGRAKSDITPGAGMPMAGTVAVQGALAALARLCIRCGAPARRRRTAAGVAL